VYKSADSPVFSNVAVIITCSPAIASGVSELSLAVILILGAGRITSQFPSTANDLINLFSDTIS